MLEFFVIYSFDINLECKVDNYKPNNKTLKHMNLTETKPDDYEIWKHKHRKYVGMLSKQEFKDLCWEQGMETESCETMGSLTFEFGLLPAISMSYSDDRTSMNIYVTPMHKDKEGYYDVVSEDNFYRVKNALLKVY